jgi:acetolactate synthase-1/2/3 large subunit
MKGAQALIRTLVGSNLDVCFANPGTSEMHFVAALDSVPEMRAVLVLFEGVATGAADGYARMAGRPASTLLHLGPGLTNALANVHNARKARVPMLNVVGDHATDHKQYDAPLTSDIEGLARPLSHWLRTSQSAASVADDAAQAVAAACEPPGKIATLILPADVSWSEAGEPAARVAPAKRRPVDGAVIDSVAKVLLAGGKAVIVMNGQAVLAEGLEAASRVANHTGARLLCDTLPVRQQRGAGRACIERLPYLAAAVSELLKDAQHLVLVGSQPPISFFAYPNAPNYLVPDGCKIHVLAEPGDEAIDALENLAEAVGAPRDAATLHEASRPDTPSGRLDAKSVAQAIGAHLPEDAIVADEAITEGALVPLMTAGGPPHDWLPNPGGSIGLGMPLATGAAIACPGRRVVCLEGDGSAMYTLQALWTQARESLDVTTVLFANRSYRILDMELQRVGAEAGGQRARDMLDISRPDLDFVALSNGMGVPATRVDSAQALAKAFARSVAEPGPHLIEVLLDS